MVAKSTGLVPIRLKVDIAGLFHGMSDPKRGDVVEVESYNAARYFAHGYAQPASVPELGDPYKPYRGAALAAESAGLHG
jgi:hypothetical protein